DRDRTAAELHAEFDALEPGSETGVMVRVAGRLLLIRRQGKLVFATLRDGTAAIQLFVSQGEVGEEGLAEFARLDPGLVVHQLIGFIGCARTRSADRRASATAPGAESSWTGGR
ncbi:MAG: lysyl-tRNA synthetase, class, partial [Actinomycetota bacterium]|nr:lysyl-tRNA synthetase, class [Actinomycetota bacterium]